MKPNEEEIEEEESEEEEDEELDEDEDDSEEDLDDVEDKDDKSKSVKKDKSSKKSDKDDKEDKELEDATARSSKYRPVEKPKAKEEDEEDDDEDENASSKNHVPLKTHLALKKKYKELRDSSADDALTQEDLDELATASGLSIEAVKTFVKVFQSKTKLAAKKEVDSKIAPLLKEKLSSSNEKAFDEDFEKTIVAKYPELKAQKANFKRIAFSKDFIHLKNLEEIRKEFYPSSKPGTVAKKTDAPEGGSKGAGDKDGEINFAKMTQEQHAKVLATPALRKKYYAWQDSQGL